MAQAPTVQAPKRWPLVVFPANREEDTNKDARLVNGYMEKELGGDFWLYKRPGLGKFSQPSGGAAVGLGSYNWLGDVYSIFGTHLYKNGVSKGTVDATHGLYRFCQCMGAVPKLQMGNGVHAYNYDDVNGLVEVAYATTVTTTGDLVINTLTVKNIPSTAAMTALDSISDVLMGIQIPPASYIVTVDSGTQVTMNAAALASATGAGIITQSAGYPTPFVKGWAYLDATTYVMDAKAALWGTNLNDPTTVDPLNVQILQIEPDGGVALNKQLVYVVGFKEWSTEILYDAANPVGSPLGRVTGAKVNWGCISADSVQEVDGALFWLATNRSAAVSVMKMDNLKAEIISTPAIERLLGEADFSSVFSWGLKYEGHRWYGVTLKNNNLTLVYDIGTGLWAQWTDVNGNYFPIVSSTYDKVTAQTLLQHETNGRMYSVDSANTNDDGAVITVDIYTPNYDGGTARDKTLSMMYFDANRIPGNVLQVRRSDDDYQTWSDFRLVDLSLAKPRLEDEGTFKRRAYDFRHQANTRFRIKAVDLQIDIGSL